MTLKTIHIIPIVFALEYVVIILLDRLFSYLNNRFSFKYGAEISSLINAAITFLLSLFGFVAVAVLFENLGIDVDVGGHNAYGAVFFMFFAVNIFGAFLIKSLYEMKNEKIDEL